MLYTRENNAINITAIFARPYVQIFDDLKAKSNSDMNVCDQIRDKLYTKFCWAYSKIVVGPMIFADTVFVSKEQFICGHCTCVKVCS